ncbi:MULTISPECIES: hypothetical protein [unclassified Pseudomonas]|uniref:Uncharacterized protein n=1 Tax=Pseudomonas sp. MYb327 TaxID=2745230 RepID=A0AAU8E3I9_9PSED
MTKLKKRITNPMTIIAIFATLSETSAAISLPFLDEDEREIYIWFLISFPFYLLLLFFATLNFNYRSLYAPSDFEKEKHFIKVLDSVERPENNDTMSSSENARRDSPTNDRRSVPSSRTAQAPPTEIGLQATLSVQHHVRLPELLNDLYIIDARWLSKKMEFGSLLETIKNPQVRKSHVILFLTGAESEALLKEGAGSKQTRKRDTSAFCVAYNLNSHEMTVIDQSSLPAHNYQK